MLKIACSTHRNGNSLFVIYIFFTKNTYITEKSMLRFLFPFSRCDRLQFMSNMLLFLRLSEVVRFCTITSRCVVGIYIYICTFCYILFDMLVRTIVFNEYPHAK